MNHPKKNPMINPNAYSTSFQEHSLISSPCHPAENCANSSPPPAPPSSPNSTSNGPPSSPATACQEFPKLNASLLTIRQNPFLSNFLGLRLKSTKKTRNKLMIILVFAQQSRLPKTWKSRTLESLDAPALVSRKKRRKQKRSLFGSLSESSPLLEQLLLAFASFAFSSTRKGKSKTRVL